MRLKIQLEPDRSCTGRMDDNKIESRLDARNVDNAVTLVAAALWSLRLGRRGSAIADIRTALSWLPHPIVHADSVVLLAAQDLPVAELHALEQFTDPASRNA